MPSFFRMVFLALVLLSVGTVSLAQEKEKSGEVEFLIGQAIELKTAFRFKNGMTLINFTEKESERWSNATLVGKTIYQGKHLSLAPYVGYEFSKEDKSGHSLLVGTQIELAKGKFENEVELLHLKRDFSDHSWGFKAENLAVVRVSKRFEVGNFTAIEKSEDEIEFQTGPHFGINLKKDLKLGFAVLTNNEGKVSVRFCTKFHF